MKRPSIKGILSRSYTQVWTPGCVAHSFDSLGAALAALFLTQCAHAADGTAVYQSASKSTVIVLQENSLGSGVLLSPTIAVTNCHVVNSGDDASVKFQKSTLSAKVVARNTRQDVCVLALASPFADARPVSAARRLSGILPGEQVYALGAPTGLSYSLTAGVVSQLRAHDGGTVIQFDAAISSGNSGGGLYDQRGALLGLTSFSRQASPLSGASTQNLNFAWSVDNFPPPAKEIIAGLVDPSASKVKASRDEASASPKPGEPTTRRPVAEVIREWELAYGAKNWPEAVQAASSWIAQSPIDPAARVARGKANEAMKPGSGFADFEAALGLRHGFPEAVFWAAKSARARGDTPNYVRYRKFLEATHPRLAAQL